jgi:hypothetical protein
MFETESAPSAGPILLRHSKHRSLKRRERERLNSLAIQDNELDDDGDDDDGDSSPDFDAGLGAIMAAGIRRPRAEALASIALSLSRIYMLFFALPSASWFLLSACP